MPRERIAMHKRKKWTRDELVEHMVLGCGLRRMELEQLRVCDIYEKQVAGYYETHWMHVVVWESHVEREVPFLEPYLWVIDAARKGRAPDDLLFPGPLPDLDYDLLRKEYAFILFSGMIEGRGVVSYPATFHRAGQCVKKALGLKRLDANLQRWLRRAKRDFLRTVSNT